MSNISLGSITILWLTTTLLLGFMILGTLNMSGFKIVGIPLCIASLKVVWGYLQTISLECFK